MSVIDFVRGQVVERGVDSVVLAVGGFGMRVLAPAGTLAALPEPGAEARLYTYLQVREDALTLYGFTSVEERELFTQLLSVTGIGPKVALDVLSSAPVERVAAIIDAGDVDALGRIRGIGKKTASRIVLDLKGKLVTPAADGRAAPATPPLNGVFELVARALREFGGFSPQEVAAAVAALPQDRPLTEEEALSLAFQAMNSGR